MNKDTKSYYERAKEYLRKSKETDDADLSDHYYKQYMEYLFKGDQTKQKEKNDWKKTNGRTKTITITKSI